MMKTISFKIDKTTFKETEKILAYTEISREQYFTEALISYNRVQNRKYLEDCLRSDSFSVRDESMRVLKEFENL